MEAGTRRLRKAQCTHGAMGHREVAHGRDDSGRARATAAAAYPADMNVALAEALLAGAAGVDAARAERASQK
eukprot:907296-Pleurochrysis_carterae.AAC.1